MTHVVLSIFPGIGLLDTAFEEEGFTVVRGPDLLWGGDIRRFHVPAGRFDGVIGGTPCQAFSRLVPIIKANGYDLAPDLIPEFERVVGEAQPTWFLMENVQHAPVPVVPGYTVHDELFDNRWLGEEQSRRHRFSFGTRSGQRIKFDSVALENPRWAPRVMAAGGREGGGVPKRRLRRNGKVQFAESKLQNTAYFREAVRLQGLPEDWDVPPFTVAAKIRALGNAVPLPMGRALAQAISRAVTIR